MWQIWDLKRLWSVQTPNLTAICQHWPPSVLESRLQSYQALWLFPLQHEYMGLVFDEKKEKCNYAILCRSEEWGEVHSGLSDVAIKWVRLAKRDKSGSWSDQIQLIEPKWTEFWSKNVPDLSHWSQSDPLLGQIWQVSSHREQVAPRPAELRWNVIRRNSLHQSRVFYTRPHSTTHRPHSNTHRHHCPQIQPHWT